MEEKTKQQKQTEDEEDKMVQAEFESLIQAYLTTKHRKKVEIITKAFNFAKQAHKGVRRLSGEPYIMHPLAVAKIVCTEIGLGSTSICSALLHDVVEDTDYTVEDIENMFGAKIAQIVDGLTKISGGIFGNKTAAQAENFKKLLITMSDDIRVILIKIADRLHNMRTLGAQAPNKRYKIAGETLYIYAPLAHRLGLNKIKNELEDLSFKYEHPEDYHYIESKLAETQAERDTLFDSFTEPIRKQLDARKLKYEIKQRVKTPFSVWTKMQAKGVPFEEVFDILAVRIIFDPQAPDTEINECFDIYVNLCKIYKAHPERFRDWVSHPKANGYQALHVTLMSKQGQWIEVQIRSRRMDEIAEKGLAAHWKYKDGEKTETTAEIELDKWLNTIKEILDDPQPSAMDFLDSIKLNLFASEIFVFTPKGELRTMPAGSTALDFAFTIHTFVGSHAIGAKVNHKLVSIDYKLKSGVQIEILTSKAAHHTRLWLNYAYTAKAKTKIQAILRRDEREAARHGEAMLDEFLKKNNLQKDSALLDKLVKLHEVSTPESLYTAIGLGNFQLGPLDITTLTEKPDRRWKRLFSFGRNHKAESDTAATPEPIDPKKTLSLTDEKLRSQYTLADCCRPISGDDVLGYIDDQNHITIHKVQCPDCQRLKASQGNRILSARWDTSELALFPAEIHVKGIDTQGLLLRVTEIISNHYHANIISLQVNCKGGIFEGNFQMFVHNRHEVKRILSSLKKVKDIKEVS